MDKVSELEGVVLGLIGHQQRCTAYQVRRALQASPSTYWSASAGAIYPLLKRLVASGHAKSVQDPDDGRGKSILSLTPRGRKALTTWILGASEPNVAASIFDAVRGRAFFLDAIPAADRQKFVNTTLGALEDFLALAVEHERGLSSESTKYERLAANGAVRVARARVEWMKEVVEATST